jgi:hypothetical protein
VKTCVRLLCALLALCAAPCFAATTYKWVDERGQVHYSDSPPEGVAYEVVQGPSRASVIPPPAAAPAVAAQAEAVSAPAEVPQRATPPATIRFADDRKCVDALYQIKLLNEKRRAFKRGPGDTRIYIDDADRPAEIERLIRERDENCSDDPETRMSQVRRADQLMESLSPDCQSSLEKLQDALSPSTRTPESEVERWRQYLEEHCPGGDRSDLWMADWMWPQKQQPPKQ